ncbi:alginate lyase family protein [Photobacterium makurazakiensis]|uniref:alginate lyase family protein n=1 Tax=Photobacterium makurazakiensis TaxID=2910234 RepID=UPI003D0C75A5
MLNKAISSAVIASAMFAAPLYASDTLPNTVFFDAELIAESKARIHNDTATVEAQASYERLIEEAESAMSVGLLSVTDKTLLPPSGDKNDYFSISPYWWPNPDTKDGLPWIRHDGNTNPDSKTDATDSVRIGLFTRSVRALGVAYYFSGEEKFAEQATKMLRHWFINSDTRMNPNVRYAQAVPGVDDQRRSGMIDSRSFSDRLVDALSLLETSKHWTAEDDVAMRAWLGDFLDWLITSEQGTAEMYSPNNHGTWMQAQIAGIAYYLGREDIAKVAVANTKWRIREQLDSKGTQPEELARTRGYHYSYFNLDAMAYLAQLGDKMGVDIWNHDYRGRNMKSGIDYVAQFQKAEEWPHKDNDVKKGRFQTYRMLTVYRKADLAWGTNHYDDVIKQIGFGNADLSNLSQVWAERDAYLLYPKL